MAELDDVRAALDRDTPKPGPRAKERAITAALAEFDRASQGNLASDRLTKPDGSSRPTNRRRGMSTLVTSWWAQPRQLAAAAALLIAVIGVPLALRVDRPAQTPAVVQTETTLPDPRQQPTPATPSGPVAPPQTATEPMAVAEHTRDSAPPAVAPAPVASTSPAAPPAPPAASAGSALATRLAPKMADNVRPPRMAEQFGGSSVATRVAPGLGRPMLPPDPIVPAPADTARYPTVETGGFKRTAEEPVSTFSIDVDTTSYAVVRAHLNHGRLPPATAVRTEELINYFPYAYARPTSRETPFAISTTVVPSPWAPERKLLHVAVQGWEIPAAERKRANLVLLVDVSGSMSTPNRLPLAKSALALLLDTLRPDDTVAIVTYAGHSGVALEPTRAAEKSRIRGAIDALEAGGSTAGFDGIATAYRLAREKFVDGGVNRVLLMTDGDFNVGPTSGDALKDLVTGGRRSGIYLSVLGFGMSNYQDTTMQALAQNGNGNASYIDTLSEARKVLVDEANQTIFPIADDVKIQVEFNPAAVAEYRLLGYETRLLRREDFNDDKVDAGEVGSGAVVTAIYEFVPAGGRTTVDPLRYGATQSAAPTVVPVLPASEYAFLRLRYKRPGEQASRLIEQPIAVSSAQELSAAGTEPRFAIAVAGFAELLRGGRHQGSFGYGDVLKIATAARGDDPYGWRGEFVQLVRLAESLARSQRGSPPADRP